MRASTTTPEVVVAPPTVDLTSYLIIHRALRDGGRRLADTVARITRREIPGPDPCQVRAIVRWYRGYHDELQLHHTVEDDLFFPALADRAAVMTEHGPRLHAEHEAIVAAMERTRRALDALADDRPTCVEAAAATEELALLLEAHLDYENCDVLPLFVRHLTAEEYDVVEAAAKKAGSMKTLAFTVPFIVAACADAEREFMFQTSPSTLKLLWYATRGRYDRLTAAAFAS